MWSFKRKYLDRKESEADWRQVAWEAVTALFELPEAAWFTPDPETTAAGYSNYIAEPMWLGRVKEKLEADKYLLPYHFKQDMALIFKNARLFNSPQDKPYRDCCILEQRFNQLWTPINAAFQRAARHKRQQQHFQQQQQRDMQEKQDDNQSQQQRKENPLPLAADATVATAAETPRDSTDTTPMAAIIHTQITQQHPQPQQQQASPHSDIFFDAATPQQEQTQVQPQEWQQKQIGIS